MTVFVGILVVLAVAAVIARPLMSPASADDSAATAPVAGELWEREKSVALIAIKEAEFDHATGKLTDDDYRILRTDYEERALRAMDELDAMAPAESSVEDDAEKAEGAPRFCTACGRPFAADDRFCGGCGTARG